MLYNTTTHALPTRLAASLVASAAGEISQNQCPPLALALPG